MKRLAILILLVIMGCAGGSESNNPAPIPTKIIIISGQSNAMGCGSGSIEAPPPNIQYYRNGNLVTDPNIYSNWGVEVGLWRNLSSQYNWIIIKYAIGGTSIEHWLPGTENYVNLMASINSIIIENNYPEISAFIWMQGENDSQDIGMANAYYGNLVKLIESIRSDLNDPPLPFLYSLVSCFVSPFDYIDIVRTAQVQVDLDVPYTVLFNFDDLPELADGVHYDSDSLKEIGLRFSVWINSN